ncbi:esterase-like activity of phytase-domain-containing protein [Pholiota molesta]|nr:esterase-like activity of phytase-domain-containing protein [Pholiota molesta]
MFSKYLSLSSVSVFFLLQNVYGSPVVTGRAAESFTTAVLDGVTYTNKGIVGFGLIPSNFVESTGDTIGGFGSAMTIKRGSFQEKDGVFTGTLLARPDRGFNVNGPIDYQARQFAIDFVLTPYTGAANLSFADAQKTLQLAYRSTTLQFERQNKTTSGLDPAATRVAQAGFERLPFRDPVLPVVARADDRLVLDVEGVVANRDGTFWISDEYGPYIYRFSADGHLLQTIQPPDAVLPRDATGALNFTSLANPATGRSPNQGFESLTYDDDTETLYAMLQSATIQDGGLVATTQRYTRLFAYNVGNPALKPRLVGEWVVPLPLSAKNKTEACSEIHFVSKGIFLALSRDGDGRGGNDDHSSYKQVDLFSIANATDIHGPNSTIPQPPSRQRIRVLPDIVDDTQLARFGLHNAQRPTLIDGKWESIALAPSDNDFLSTQGISLGVPFNAGLDVDNEVLVFRVTLPARGTGNEGGKGWARYEKREADVDEKIPTQKPQTK